MKKQIKKQVKRKAATKEQLAYSKKRNKVIQAIEGAYNSLEDASEYVKELSDKEFDDLSWDISDAIEVVMSLMRKLD